MADLEGDVEFGEILLILVIFLFVGYLIYKGFGSLADLLKNFKLPSLGDLFKFNGGGNVTSSGTGSQNAGNATAGDGGTGCGKIKIEIGAPPATASGANSDCGGAQANCCTGSGCGCQ